MREAAFVFGREAGDEHVVQSVGIAFEHAGVAESGPTRGTAEEGVGRGFLEGAAVVVADGAGEVLAGGVALKRAGGVEGVDKAVRGEERTGANGFFPFVVELDRGGMVLPVDEVGGVAQHPNVAAQTAEAGVVPLVEQPVHAEAPAVRERHAVAHKKAFFGGFEFLDALRAPRGCLQIVHSTPGRFAMRSRVLHSPAEGVARK
jgi:hypothetical protein